MLDSFKKLLEDKKEYRQMMLRVDQLPEAYQFVFKKIQDYMWSLGPTQGMDVLKIQYGLIELFETSAAEGKHVLDITGTDVAAFADELLKEASTYAENRHETLNREIRQKLGRG